MIVWLLACVDDGVAVPGDVAAAPAAAPPEARTVADAFPVPEGYERVPTDAWGDWLRALPVRAADVPVRTYAGDVVGHAARVIDLPVVPGDLQQCADSLYRLRAEWERARGGSPTFHATSGDPVPWARYAAGEEPYEADNRLRWRRGGTGDWDDWLVKLFTWAGTRSLAAYDTEPAADVRGGRLVVRPGSPGHAIVLLDVVRRGDELRVLVGEGYMPAQDFHVELGPADGWWVWRDGVALAHWDMPASGLRAFRDPGT